MRNRLSLLVAAALVGAPVGAQDRTGDVDKLFTFATPETPGCAVGVSQRGTVLVNRAYGLANVERRVPLGERSLFDIGSTQKQFTAAAVLLLVEDGRLSLSEDIRTYLPELPDYGHPITLDHLLSNRSGLRDWSGLLPMAEEGVDVLKLILRQRAINFPPGEQWSYSSSGFELAKEIVARTSGMPFGEFLRRRLFEPLGMRSSAYVPDMMHAGPNAAFGYQKDGAGWKPFMRLGNLRGGGAIVSTVGDLLLWNDALMSGRLGAFVTGKLHEPIKLSNGRTLRYARGLFVDYTPGGTVVQHSGEAYGFSTWMAHYPDKEHGLSVVVSCNFDPVSATDLGVRVSDLFLPPVDPRAPQLPRPVAVAGVDVTGRAGLFFHERTGQALRLVANNGRLSIAGGPPLVPVAPDRFRAPRPNIYFLSQDDFELSFAAGGGVELKSMEGQVTRYRRAEPWTPTAADLRAADGRYESKELGTVWHIVPGANTLVARFEHAPDRTLELEPVERDTWMRGTAVLRFRRDAGGTVTGFDYANPGMRDVRFARLGDRVAARAPSSAPAAPLTQGAPAAEALVGYYELAPGRGLTITLEQGTLYGEASGGDKKKLAPQSGTTFAVEGTGMTLTFTVGADGRATALVMRQGGNERTLPKTR